MRPLEIFIDPANVDDNGIAETQKPAASGVQSLTLDGALADLGTAGVFDVGDSDSSGIKGRILAIASNGNDAGRTITITGTDPEGVALVEAMNPGPNTETLLTTGYFQTVTSITVDDDTAGNIIVGTSNATNSLCTAAIPLNWRSNYPATVSIVGSSGTYVADFEQTVEELVTQTSQDVTWLEFNADKAADAVLTPPDRHATGIRCHLDSYTNTAALTVVVLQN